MAQAKRSSLAVAGALAASMAAVALPPAATAQDVTPVSQTEETVWTDELRAFDEAATAARDYSENNYGVGILIHVGEDFPNEYFETPEQFAAVMVDIFENNFKTPASAFLSPNPGTPNTGLTYHIGHLIHADANSSAVKGVIQALEAIPSVVEQLKLMQDPMLRELGQLRLTNDN